MQSSGRIAVVGAGFMGTVLSTLYARHGYQISLNDSDKTALSTYRDRAGPIAQTLANDRLSAAEILDRVRPTPALVEALDGAFLVHENVPEVLQAKQELFALLDKLCGPNIVLATNTASFLLSDVCRKVELRDRVIGIHYITPGHIIRAVELIHADFTPTELIEWARTFLSTIDHVGIACRERPGFLVNRIQFALLSEVYQIVEEGWATLEDVDAVVRLSLGPRLALWGPLLTEDLVVNKRNALAVAESLYDATKNPKFAVRAIVRKLIEDGRLGAISGRGWYDFKGDYSAITSRRDNQLRSLLEWLGYKDFAAEILQEGQTQ